MTYFYDSGGLVNGVSGNDDLAPNYVPRIDYDKFGHRLLLQIGDSTATTPNTQTTYAYDPATQRLTTLQATLSSCYTFHNMNFSYDNVGNVTQIQNDVTDPHNSGCLSSNAIGGLWTKTYEYDDLYRLTRSTGSFGNTSPTTYDFHQRYDSIHNITHKDQTAASQTTYNWDYTYAGPHPHGPTAIGTFTLTLDLNGNQTSTLNTGTGSTLQYLYGSPAPAPGSRRRAPPATAAA